MSGDVTEQALSRLSHLPNNPSNPAELIAAQRYYDVDFTGGSISNVILTDVTINGESTTPTVRVITAPGDVTIQNDDNTIVIDKTIPQITTVTLPSAPVTGRTLTIKDGAGNADTYNITINGDGNDIDGSATLVLTIDWQSATLRFDGNKWENLNAGVPGSGTVTSVAMTGDNVIFNTSVPGSPITSSGTLAPTLKTQSANLIFAGPTIGVAATPTFRALVGADLPNPSASTLGGVQSKAVVASNFLTGISTSGVVSAAQPAASDLSNGTTGSGAVVLATSPTLTTPNIGSATGSVSGNAGTATALQTARNIGGVSFDGTANIVPQTIQTVDDTSDTSCFLLFGNASGSQSQQPKTNSSLTFNASTGALGSTSFVGAFTGNASTATALQTARTIGGVSFNGTANIVPQTIESANEAADTTCFPLFVTASGTQQLQPKNNASFTLNSSNIQLGVGSIVFSTTTEIVGTTTNNDAASGSVGQIVSNSIPLGSAVSLTTNTAANVTSISVPAGDWDIWGVVDFNGNAATTVVQFIGGISSTSATLPTLSSTNPGIIQNIYATFSPFGTGQPSLSIPAARFSLSTTTTIYLIAQAQFSVNSCSAYGGIYARRRR